jgi:hypothetical protein
MEVALSENPPRRDVAGWGWFCGFAAVGGLTALGAVSLGALALLPAIVVAYVLLRRDGARRSAFGLLSGAGLLLLYVAWLQRDGPGTTCWHKATSSGCEQHLNPIPWLVIGTVLAVAGVAGHVARR